MKHYILKMINDFESFVVVRMLYDNPRAEERYNNARKSISACISMLAECETYFEARADADCDQDGYIPNEEMRILVEIKEALNKIR